MIRGEPSPGGYRRCKRDASSGHRQEGQRHSRQAEHAGLRFSSAFASGPGNEILPALHTTESLGIEPQVLRAGEDCTAVRAFLVAD